MLLNVPSVCCGLLRAFLCLALAMTASVDASDVPAGSPKQTGLSLDVLSQIDELAQEGISAGKMPGCVVLVGRHGRIAYHKAFGHRQLKPSKERMTVDTIFDLASLTKPVATASAILLLEEDGRLKLDDRVARHIADFAANGKQKITIQQLLTHTSGLIPDNALSDYDDGRVEAIDRINALKPRTLPGAKFAYSDVGFMVLAELIEARSRKNVNDYTQEFFFAPLGMNDTGFLPAKEKYARCATTEKRDGRWLRGEVHDPRAFRLKGVAGHAGLFSTSADLAKFCQMLLNEGYLGDRRVLLPRTVRRMREPISVKAETSATRTNGWDHQSAYSSNRGTRLSDSAFGHGGFTGTAMWVDPELDLFVIFLSNRVHPDGKGRVNSLAGQIADTVVDAIIDLPTEPIARRSEDWFPDQLIGKLAVEESPHDGFRQLRLQGWTMQLNGSLCEQMPKQVQTMLEVMDVQLSRIVNVVPPAALIELQAVPIWVNPTYPDTSAKAEYHPGRQWLVSNGRSPLLVKGVEVTNTQIFAKEDRRMPYVMLHELAHAYHDRVLGFNHEDVAEAFRLAERGGLYDNVDRWTGRRIVKDRAYALSNAREYFAETTEAYFGRNDFFPFDNAELKQADPDMHRLLKRLWKFEESE